MLRSVALGIVNIKTQRLRLSGLPPAACVDWHRRRGKN